MVALLVAAAAVGSTCLQPQVIHRQSYAVQSYVAPQVLYFVGQPIRVQSLVEQQKRSDPDYQEFLEFKAWKAGARSAANQQQSAEPPFSVSVKSACAQCHGKAEPDGGFFLDGAYGIEPARITKAIRAIASGEMPKNRQLNKDQKNQLLADLLSLEYQDESSTEPPQEPEP
jgi:cytochrome c553